MFSHFKGTETLPIINTKGDFNPLWWHASIEGNRVFVKVHIYQVYDMPIKILTHDPQLVNAAQAAVPLTLSIDFHIKSVNGTILRHDDEYGFNYIGNATAISPVKFTLKNGKGATITKDGPGGNLKWNVPPLSVTVLELQ